MPLDATPTWMAPHAKAVALYDSPFWRENGLSGRIASQSGPLVEAHDHSGPDGSPAALFGFIGWPYATRAKMGTDLQGAILDQLTRCFGADSPKPKSIHIEDWAGDPLVTTADDLTGPMAHPPGWAEDFAGASWFRAGVVCRIGNSPTEPGPHRRCVRCGGTDHVDNKLNWPF